MTGLLESTSDRNLTQRNKVAIINHERCEEKLLKKVLRTKRQKLGYLWVKLFTGAIKIMNRFKKDTSKVFQKHSWNHTGDLFDFVRKKSGWWAKWAHFQKEVIHIKYTLHAGILCTMGKKDLPEMLKVLSRSAVVSGEHLSGLRCCLGSF